MEKFLFIGVGGFCGSVGRFLLAQALNSLARPGLFPWGTLGVNLLGCFLIGLVGAFFISELLHPNYRLFFVAGLLGGFTTFSSFSFETFELLRRRELFTALAYVLSSTLLGLALTAIGYLLGERIATRIM